MLYRERVRVPLGWWVLAAVFALTLAVAIGFYLGPVWGGGVAIFSFVAVALGFRTASYDVVVDDQEIRVGRAVVERRWIGAVSPRDTAGTRARAGVEADARAHLVLRPWVATSVELTLDDPADPVPYWLVSTRRPGSLATALGWTAESSEPAGPAEPRVQTS